MLAELLQLYRVQRHDFLNHFQVVMGYLQMDKGNAALDYLRRAAADSVVSAPLAHLQPPEFAVELMLLASSCFKYGVEFESVIPEGLPEVGWSKVYSEAVAIIRALVPGLSRLELGLQSVSGGIRLIVSFYNLAAADWQKGVQAVAALDVPTVEVSGVGRLGLEIMLSTR